MAGDGQKPHAILVAYPLQGHVIPSVHLALKLASRGFTITFLNTQSIHHQTAAAHAAGDADLDIFAGVRSSGLDIRYATVPDGLPLHFDRSLHHDQFMAALLHLFSAHVEEAVRRILQSSPNVTSLIADTFFVWPAAIAKKFDLIYVSFWTEPALVFALYYHMDLLRKNGHFACHDIREDNIDYVPGVDAIDPKDLPSYLQHPDPSPATVCHQIIFKAFDAVRSADLVLCNTVQELEPATVSALRARIQFYAVGALSGSAAGGGVATSLWSEHDCSGWLDSMPPASVLYVSFGSYAHVTRREVEEVAEGLRVSGVAFLWVIRPDMVSSGDGGADPLPAGFREEMGGRGVVVPWCVQVEVLEHAAVGGFLTHCGWNSVVESVGRGVPMLCFPLLTDQFRNRRLVVEEWRVGIDLTRRRGRVGRAEVSEGVRRLMGGGEEIRRRVRRLRSAVEAALTPPHGSSATNLDRFTADLEQAVRRRGAH